MPIGLVALAQSEFSISFYLRTLYEEEIGALFISFDLNYVFREFLKTLIKSNAKLQTPNYICLCSTFSRAPDKMHFLVKIVNFKQYSVLISSGKCHFCHCRDGARLNEFRLINLDLDFWFGLFCHSHIFSKFGIIKHENFK